MAETNLNFQIKTQSGSLGSSNTVVIEITNMNEVLKVIRDLDSKWIGGIRKDFRKVGKIAQKEVANAIPGRGSPPLSGMKQVHFGRLAWGTNYGGAGTKPRPAKSVLIQTPNTRKKKYRELEKAPVLRLQIGSPATVLLDMGGRVFGSKGRKGMTPMYDYMYTIGGQKVPGKRQHRVVPFVFAKGFSQAKGIRSRNASRIVYPAVERAMPAVTREMGDTISKINNRINQELLRRS